jgi:hypothetical protein
VLRGTLEEPGPDQYVGRRGEAEMQQH